MPSQMTTAGKEISHVNGTELSQTYLQIVQVVLLLLLSLSFLLLLLFFECVIFFNHTKYLFYTISPDGKKLLEIFSLQFNHYKKYHLSQAVDSQSVVRAFQTQQTLDIYPTLVQCYPPSTTFPNISPALSRY